MPISWLGTLQQDVGRLHRLHDSKKIVEVCDYVDSSIPMLARMFEKRLRGIRRLDTPPTNENSCGQRARRELAKPTASGEIGGDTQPHGNSII
jgi:hypothetical protein